MAPAASEPDDGFQLGDAIKWLLFLVPWSVFSLYCLLALSAQLGLVGVVEAVALALVSLPFWRRVCRRPVYLPYTALLRRHLARLDRPTRLAVAPKLHIFVQVAAAARARTAQARLCALRPPREVPRQCRGGGAPQVVEAELHKYELEDDVEDPDHNLAHRGAPAPHEFSLYVCSRERSGRYDSPFYSGPTYLSAEKRPF